MFKLQNLPYTVGDINIAKITKSPIKCMGYFLQEILVSQISKFPIILKNDQI